jgi:anti-sigma factor RsiW
VLSCYRVRGRIGPFVDGALGGTEQAFVARHLSCCARCETEAATIRRLRDLLRGTLEVTEPDWSGFWPGIVRGVEERRLAAMPVPRRARSWRPRWALGGALAAAAIVAAAWQLLPGAPVAQAPVIISSADTEHPDGTVMVYGPPDHDFAVVWVFGVDE